MKHVLAILSILSFFFIVSSTNTSCTKTNTTHDSTTVVHNDTTIVRDTIYQHLKNPITGFWVGTWKLSTDLTDSSYYTLTINGNGRMSTTSIGWTNNVDATEGNWQLSGTSFTASVQQLDDNSPVYVQALTAVYDSVAGTLTGTAHFTQGAGGDQTFQVFRVQ